jgi:hypothetical protein
MAAIRAVFNTFLARVFGAAKKEACRWLLGLGVSKRLKAVQKAPERCRRCFELSRTIWAVPEVF